MPAELFKVRLTRDSPGDSWGFSVTGGKDQLLVISELEVGGLAEQVGLITGDVIAQINNERSENMSGKEAQELLKKTEKQVDLLFIRNLDNVIEDPRYQGIKPKDRKKVGFHDVLKPVLRKDWNCPWVKRDGKGLKQVVRNYFGTDPVPAPIKTSHNHFYSEPQSILAPEASHEALEELERIIQEKLAQEAQEKQSQQNQARQQQQVIERQHMEQQVIERQHIEQQRIEQQRIEKQTVAHHQEVIHEVDGSADVDMKEQQVWSPTVKDAGEDEEDFCPALETVETLRQEELERVEKELQQSSFSQESFADNSSLFREIARAIQAGMEQYQGSSEGFEPSADELIDVLKNLENLAAANPALYRAIVDQIKASENRANTSETKSRQQELINVHQQPSHRRSDQCVDDSEEQYQQEGALNGHGHQEECEQQDEYAAQYRGHENSMDEIDRQQQAEIEAYEMEVAQSQEQAALAAEAFHKEQVRQQLEEEHAEELRQFKQSRKAFVQEPPQQTTITVVAGSRNRPAWPIAPGVANGTVPRTIEITSGGVETEEEMMRNRLEVAQAAGLRHVEVIHGDETFYPQPMKDYDYPWAGSLRPVSNKLSRRDHAARRGSDDNGPMPWSGSLRHVDEKKRNKAKPKPDDEVYGDAPWMGTLRHVKQENSIPLYVKPQFKRYPDEDAPNPYNSIQGCHAKPCYPLTPAAIISASGGSKEEREQAKQDEEVDRIRNNLRETRTVSSSLLRALMPKLLKEHQNKCEPLDHMESIRIMEEILGMQIGLNTVQVEDDDEAEEMIRAIENGGDPSAIATQLKKKKKVGDKKKKKPASKASTKELAKEVEA